MLSIPLIAVATTALSLLSICIAAIALYNSHYRRKVEVIVMLVRAWAKNPGTSLVSQSKVRDEVGISVCITNCGNTPIVLWGLYAVAGDVTRPRQWLYTDEDFVPIGVKPGDSTVATFILRTDANFSLPTNRQNEDFVEFSFEAELQDFRGYAASVSAGSMRVKSIMTDGIYTGGAVGSQRWKVKKNQFRRPKFLTLDGVFNK